MSPLFGSSWRISTHLLRDQIRSCSNCWYHFFCSCGKEIVLLGKLECQTPQLCKDAAEGNSRLLALPQCHLCKNLTFKVRSGTMEYWGINVVKWFEKCFSVSMTSWRHHHDITVFFCSILESTLESLFVFCSQRLTSLESPLPAAQSTWGSWPGALALF